MQCVGCFFLLGCLLAVQATAATDDQGWQAFEIRDGHIALPVKVNGVEGWALVDTGATGISLNEVLFNRGEIRAGQKTVIGALSKGKENVVSDVEVKFLGHEITLERAPAFPLHNFLMLLGRNGFGRQLLQIDYPNQRMRLLNRAAIEERNFGNIPTRRSRYGVIVQVSVPDTNKSLWLILDTGNNSAVITRRRTAARNKLLNSEAEGKTYTQDIHGTIASMERHRIPELQVGPFIVEDASLFVEAEEDNPMLASHGRSNGLAGYDLFKHFLLTIDFHQGQVHVSVPETL